MSAEEAPPPARDDPRPTTEPVGVTGAAPARITDACLAPADVDPIVRYRPPCELAVSTVFWRWPGNVVVVPSEAAGGSCHDADLWFPAPTSRCRRALIVRIGEDAVARTLDDQERVPDEWAAVVQVGIVELPITPTAATFVEVGRVAGPRVALAIRSHGAPDLTELAPVADRLVVLSVGVPFCEPDDCVPIDLSRLPPMPALRTLHVWGDRARGIASLRRHRELTGLALDVSLEPGEATALATLSGLTALTLRDEQPSALRRLTRLEQLRIRGSVASLRALTHHGRLTTLGLRGPLDDATMAEVARLPSLRHLSLPMHEFTDRGARHLRQARRLRTLVVVARAEPEDAVIERLAEVPSLARHPTAEVVLDADESVPDALEEPWRTVACRAEGALCAAPAPPDATAREVDRFLD